MIVVLRCGLASRVLCYDWKEVIIIVGIRASNVHYRVLIVSISLGRHKSETETLKVVVSGSVLLHHTGATFHRNVFVGISNPLLEYWNPIIIMIIRHFV